MTSTAAGWALTGLAIGLILAAAPLAGFFVASAAVAVLVTTPDPRREDARRRNQARRIR